MKTFVVQMDCVKGREQLVMEHAGMHIKWMLENLRDDVFIAAGPYINAAGAFDDGLCIMRADSEAELRKRLETDPFYREGIRTFTIREWDYHVDEAGYRIEFPPELKQKWGLA